MAGVQGSALAVAVCEAGGLGSLPCAMLGPDAIRDELTAIRAQTTKPYNVNFFCHAEPEPDDPREQAWRAALAPYFAELEVDPDAIPSGPGRLTFGHDAADVREEFRRRRLRASAVTTSHRCGPDRTRPGVERSAPAT
jgi:nitronate monooxygenase